MGRVEIDGAEGSRVVCVDGLEETDRVGDAVDDGLVFCLLSGVLDVGQGPLDGVVEIGKAGAELGADVVEGCGRVEVGGDEARWVGLALGWVETVDVVAAEGGDCYAVDDFGWRGAGFGELTSDTGNTNDFGVAS